MVNYFRDLYANVHLSPARIARFKAAVAEVTAYYRRICGKP
jgi:hypothetical protein